MTPKRRQSRREPQHLTVGNKPVAQRSRTPSGYDNQLSSRSQIQGGFEKQHQIASESSVKNNTGFSRRKTFDQKFSRSNKSSMLSGTSTGFLRPSSVRSGSSIGNISTREETLSAQNRKRPKNFMQIVTELISYITFERIVISILFFIMVSMIFIFVRQQSTINAMSEELAVLRSLMQKNHEPKAQMFNQEMNGSDGAAR